MITKNKKVHYCEHCGKHGLMSNRMSYHEKHCTLNPKRECGLCGRKGGLEGIIQKYSKVGRIEQIVGDVDIEKLSDDVSNCPACTLAVVRCAKLSHVEFDYQKTVQKWWDERRAETYTENYN